MREDGLKPYYVVLKCPVFLRNVESVEDACNIAVREVSKKVPKFVEGGEGCEEHRQKSFRKDRGCWSPAFMLGLEDCSCIFCLLRSPR
jgi:hypothetical protein